MQSPALIPRRPIASTALAVLLMSPATARAQAWVPPQGEGTAAILFTNVLSKNHFLPDERFDLGHIHANTLLFDLTYGISDRAALNVAFPLIFSRYVGGAPHRPVTLDDGAWHTTAQDFRFGIRYNVAREPLVVTPFVGATVPSHGYEYYAHAAPGRQRRELMGGVSIAKLFPERGIVLQGRYAFAVPERIVGYRPRYSDMSLEAAYFFGPTFRVFAMGSGRYSHSGIDLYPGIDRDVPAEIFRNHDRVSREHVLNIGGGAAVSITRTVDLFGSYTTTIAGRNTHAVNRGIAIGVSWSFDTNGVRDSALASQREGSLVRCLCEKGKK